MIRPIDLNADLGECLGPGAPEDDADLLDIVTSANIACGFHAGNPDTMARTAARAAACGVALGAHPGLPDRQNFGRHAMALDADQVCSLVTYQIGALAAFARRYGHSLHHVKPHGALYHMAEQDTATAQAIALAVWEWDPQLCVYGLSGGHLLRAAREQGLRTAAEVFADRTYQPDGTLTPRTQPDALLYDPDFVAERMVQLVMTGKLTAVDGTELTLAADTICLHGDTPSAVERIRALRDALVEQGIPVHRP
jgi:UPF0271 protein